MAPESCQEAEGAEKEASLSLVDQEPVNGHLEPPAGTPQESVAPTCPQDTKPSSPRVVFSVNLQSAPESLDPRTLRLLWGQRGLEIQALRWAIQNHQDARHCHVLHEVAGLPPKRSACNREKFLQNQVQKLTLELKEQKEQAQLEKSQLEERLLQTVTTMQQLEAELQAFQKSCLLQLARSSWVGRILRSSTGSVEVVTAETLMDFSDLSESEQGPSTGEGFRLEDVDWNSIAQRYPNLFINIESSSDQKHPRPLPPPQSPLLDEWGSELHRQHMEQHLKSVEWSSLPFVGTSSSGGADSDSSSGQLAEHYRMQKVTGHPPGTPGRNSSELTEARSRSLSREMQTQPEGSRVQPSCSGSDPGSCSSPKCTLRVLQKAHQDQPGKTVLMKESCADPEHPHSERHWSPTGSCLKIVAVNGRERFVRVLNQSLEETVDLGGLMLQQHLHDFPVCMYRFPLGTLLAPRHHVTVWGEGPRSTKKQLPSSLGQEPVHFHSSRGYVTLLLNPKGEVLSKHQAPHCVSPTSRIFADNTDLSIDRFLLSEAGHGADTCEQKPGPQHSHAGRVREARARRRRPRTRVLFPPLSTSKIFRPREVPAQSEAAETLAPELLPAIPAEAGLCLEDCQARKEHRVRVCRKRVDRSCPMVALSVQSTAESRYGFRFLPCPPVTSDSCWGCRGHKAWALALGHWIPTPRWPRARS
ncbi:PREDICTED: lamin tail domain-containing protein 2 [Odobenus rosmarus divergens]|uniref:Lamin tail domain-containing protein 2 n=1 Tax=Odobenus rosmarus divergens TaxID=9708 RepID=A0A2U3W6T4_ODORO|nr:PREDICTED: lamin tail domain-containing protein 2 [Odobenus rosmarus divergens]